MFINESQLLCRLYALFHVSSGKMLLANAEKFNNFLLDSLEYKLRIEEERRQQEQAPNDGQSFLESDDEMFGQPEDLVMPVLNQL